MMTTATTTFTLDPAALATYSTVAQDVSQQLAVAATTAGEALSPDRFGTEFGSVGAAFAAQFAAAVLQHCQQLAGAGHLVDAYGRAMGEHGEALCATDSAMAAALARVHAPGDTDAGDTNGADVAGVDRRAGSGE